MSLASRANKLFSSTVKDPAYRKEEKWSEEHDCFFVKELCFVMALTYDVIGPVFQWLL